MTTVAAALQQARQSGLERLDAQVLLLHLLDRAPHDRAWLIAHDTDPLPEHLLTQFQGLCAQRLAGEPVAYLVGHREFHGLDLQVDHRVLDPRPDTETLVDWALERLQDRHSAHVLDLGTGSGAIALAIRHRQPAARVWALDASTDALAVAQANAERLNLPVQMLQGQWLRDWPARPWTPGTTHPPDRFDLIVSNPPYIRSDDPHLAQLTHEPLSALASGPDGLQDIRDIVTQARHHLKPDGWLLLEHGWDQADDVATLLAQAGYRAIDHRLDLAGHRRCTGAQTPT